MPLRSFLEQSGYVLDGASQVWLRPSYSSIAYSDGDEVESRIASVVEHVRDLSVLSMELRPFCTDWTTLYHLSGMRANILRPLEGLIRGDVLEIGAGCGAITRYLGELGANVLAVEGTRRRAAITRSRTRDLENVAVLAERFDQFQCSHRFDFITMIGVLEYASLYESSDDPPLRMLERVRELLKPGGAFILAIENQLGLKYFAGAPEDHIGRPMVGIEGRYGTLGAQTYGCSVLKDLLGRAGFSAQQFLAPFPDYKFPVSIVTEAGFSTNGFDPAPLASQCAGRDKQLPLYCNFSLELAWPEVIKNSLGMDLANSFLIVSSVEPSDVLPQQDLAYHYSVDRIPPFCKETRFVRGDRGEVLVRYRRIESGPRDNETMVNSSIRLSCRGSQEYVSGKPLSQAFMRIVTDDGWRFDDVGQFVLRYLLVINTLSGHAGIHDCVKSLPEMLPGEFIDAIPQNIIVRPEGECSLIDQEWQLAHPIEVGYLLFRSLLSLMSAVPRFGRPATQMAITNRKFIEGSFNAAGLTPDQGDLERWMTLEAEFQQNVTGRAIRDYVVWWMEQPVLTGSLSQAIEERNARLQSLEQTILERNQETADFARTMAESEERIVGLQQLLLDVETQLAEQGREAARQQQALAEQEARIADISSKFEVREKRVNELEDDVSIRAAQLQSMSQILAVRGKELASLSAAVAGLRNEISAMLSSKSWRLTAPLRAARRIAISRPYRMLRKTFSNCSRNVWRSLPVSNEFKQRIKERAFRILPFAFSWSAAYRNWENCRGMAAVAGVESGVGKQSGPTLSLPGSDFVPLLHGPAHAAPSARLIAFYLPQFHRIPENDSWWGEGFTEWSNVKPAQPQFRGHYQPRIPGELGYYNLLARNVQQRQVELAQLYGIGGFCFYFYWFGGRTLLEQPIWNYLNDPSLTLPFCICWANESWTRRWDGLESDVLIAQRHSLTDDLAFINYVSRYLRDDRYIRIAGRPLLVIYRPSLLPCPTETAAAWRAWCRDNGIGEIFLAYTQSFDTVDPREYGFDAAIEFPPNNSSPPTVRDGVRPLGEDFACNVYDWNVFVERSFNYRNPGYTVFRGICPSWDNTARRRNAATIFVNSSPDRYRLWLENAIEDTHQRFSRPDERLVFVNAWNEWAEGAYLEPDMRFGYAYLDATRRAVNGAPASSRRIVVVSHDAHPHGAQFLAMAIARHLKVDLHLVVEIVLLGPGRLRDDFAALAPVHELNGADFDCRSAMRVAESLRGRGFTRAIVNTTASGLIVPVFQQSGIDCACLIHELPGVVQELKLEIRAREIARSAKVVIFPAQVVADGFARFATVPDSKIAIRPQGLYRRNRWRFDRERARVELRQRIGIATASKIVLAVGYADHRKGVDLFVDCAFAVLQFRKDVHFIWVGHGEPEMQRQCEARLSGSAISSQVHFVGYDPDTSLYHAGSDLYALTSREDPFPNVVLESLDVGVPVVAFASSGGGALLVEQAGGRVVPPWNIPAFAEALCRLLDDRDALASIGARGQSCIDAHYSFRQYLFDICSYVRITLPRITVIVPNFNYARYLDERLDSIRGQTYPIHELIILDDGSTDGSLDKIAEWLDSRKCEGRVVANTVNSGSVFAQWREGLQIASGDYIWVAEADDLSSPDFLECVMPPFVSKDIVLSYCESQQIDSEGRVMTGNYLDYLRRFSADRWSSSYVADGLEEVQSFLAIGNTIPNVSAVVFRREVLHDVFERSYDEILRFKRAGDWIVYFRTLLHGRIAFTPRAANYHRRHGGSVIGGSEGRELYSEIESVQRLIASEVDVSAHVRKEASSYLRELSKQLNGESEPEVFALKG